MIGAPSHLHAIRSERSVPLFSMTCSMQTFAQKQHHAQRPLSSSVVRPNMATHGPHHREHPILHLQRTIGNQAVLRMLRTHTEEPDVGLTAAASPRFGHPFSQIPIHPPAAGAIQTNLAINKPGDEYEQETYRLSGEVMRMHEPQLQRTCACGGGCQKCQTEQQDQEPERLQTTRVESGSLRQTAVPPIVHEVLRSPGQPLDAATRASMEPRFGYDFSRVRVHADPRAAESARAVDALAYTVGHHIAFGQRQYSPESTEGIKLLAHELTHVMQRPVLSTTAPTALDIADDPHLEQEAESMAMGAGGRREPLHPTAHRASAALLRQKTPSPAPKKPTPADIIEEARAAAHTRVLIAHQRIQGVGPPGPPGPRSAELDALELQLQAKRLAQVLFNWSNPNMPQVGQIVSRMLSALRPGSSVVQAASTDPNCAGLVPGFVVGNKPPIVVCPRFFSMSPEDRIRNMVHELAHVAGIGQPKSESYFVEWDCKSAGDFNTADSWAHYVNCLSGQPPDVPIGSKPSGGSSKPAPSGKP